MSSYRSLESGLSAFGMNTTHITEFKTDGITRANIRSSMSESEVGASWLLAVQDAQISNLLIEKIAEGLFEFSVPPEESSSH